MSSPFTLRPYQQDAVDATLQHFRKTEDAAVIVLPTGAGKSLVIAELAKLAKRKILVLAHVKELVEQNHAKYESYGLKGGIFSAGLKRKQNDFQVTFASIQSVSANLDRFSAEYSLLIIDECHRLNDDDDSQYGKIISQLRSLNPQLKVLGLTATPYRLGMGWIYQYHHRGFARSSDPKPFKYCIYELPLSYMVRNGYLTEPKCIDASITQYDFSALKQNRFGEYAEAEVNQLLGKHPRVTQTIIEQVKALSQTRQGVMVFAATVKHAQEICGYLPVDQTALITGATDNKERDQLIQSFKQKKLKFLVNVSVLTTGFDAPHVDFIAILRPTQSVSLYQQIVGRGLRLAEGKTDCLVIDYAGNHFNLHHPEVGEKKPNPDTDPVQVFCPSCGFANIFWGKTDDEGNVIEHYGRRCQGLLDFDPTDKQELKQQPQQCDYRFRFKECPHCNAENDIAARNCHKCKMAIIDPDDQLKNALKLKDAMVIRCSGMELSSVQDRLKVTYYGEDGEELSESFDFSKHSQTTVFNNLFGKRIANAQAPKTLNNISEVLAIKSLLTAPDFVIARKQKHYWRVQERIFDYEGKYRKANQL
ncbi:DEAD/DEAH box helicase family protein [Neptuniibacter marinus]|uniref:DEAD/DEAH box helicase family protein n=1 Tax=Neptuniibacter marinus TaxID=1806670 RepID=UPI003B5A4C11